MEVVYKMTRQEQRKTKKHNIKLFLLDLIACERSSSLYPCCLSKLIELFIGNKENSKKIIPHLLREREKKETKEKYMIVA